MRSKSLIELVSTEVLYLVEFEVVFAKRGRGVQDGGTVYTGWIPY